MMVEEFERRVEKFIKNPRETFGADYEPAYMEAQEVNKDDFCAILKDERVRALVTDLSHALTTYKGLIDGEKRKREATERLLKEANERAAKAVDVARNSFGLISASCDRALTSLAEVSFAAGVAATH